MADNDDGDYDSVAAMADRLKLTGNDRSRYIHKHMTGLGYRMEPSYVPREDDDENDDDDYFPKHRRNRSSHDDDDRRTRNRRRSPSDSDDWYS